jgi:hypothetical protein
MRKLFAFGLVIAVALACSGRSRRSEFLPGPEPATGGTLGAGGEDGTDGGRNGEAGRDAGLGASGGDGAGRGGATGSGASAGNLGSGARAGGGDAAVAGTGSSTGGSSEAGAPGAGTGGSAGSPPVTSCNETFAFLGTWEGSRLDFYFEPLESVRLEFATDERGEVFGRIRFGAGDPPPEPVDGDTPYPPGYWDDVWRTMRGRAEPWPGYAYTVVRGAGCDAKLRFGIATSELFDEWCGMMEPVYTNEYGWGCTIQGGGSFNETECVAQAPGQSATYPTWKCLACGLGSSKVCACDESSCFANPEPDLTFDFTLSEAEGRKVLTAPDYSCGDCTIRLTQAE